MSTKILSALTKDSESRTTCTLSTEGNVALDCLTKEYGLTQKQVFSYFFTNDEIDKDLLRMAIELNQSPALRQTKKSLVVARKNLKLLNSTAKSTKLQRDAIIDFGFRYLAMIFKNATSLQKEQHAKAVHTLNDLLSYACRTEQSLKEDLGEDDAILYRVSKIIVMTMNLIDEINENIKNGTQINPEGM